MSETKQQRIDELERDNSRKDGQIEELESQAEKHENSMKSRWESLNQLSQEREGNLKMLMDIITMLVAPEIIKERDKHSGERRDRLMGY